MPTTIGVFALMAVVAPARAQAETILNEVAKLLAADGAFNDFFGGSVAMSGSTALVRAGGDDGNGSSSGSVYVFIRDSNGVWTQQTKLLPDENATNVLFGFSVAIDFDTAIVGASMDNGNGSSTGSVYVFTRDTNGVWMQQATLIPDEDATDDIFGIGVSIDSGTAIVGASLDDDNGTDSGSAYIFVRDAGGAWTQQAKLLASDGSSGDRFGSSVAIHGDTVVLGAVNDDDHGANSGSAYVFVRDANGAWTQQAKLLTEDGVIGDFFGFSVSISGETVVAGASLDDDNNTNSGSAYVFARDAGGAWTQQDKLLPDDGALNDQFGTSVSISGDKVIVGASRHDDNGTDSGAAYIFRRNANGSWTQRAKLLPSDGAANDLFSVNYISGDSAIVGARFDDDLGANSGSAYIFDLAAAGAFSLQAPKDGTVALFPLTPTLSWSQPTGVAIEYTVTIATDAALTRIVLQQGGVSETMFDVPMGVLSQSTIYHWGVTAENVGGATLSTPTSSMFTTLIPGDLNGDGVVDGADLATLLVNWGTVTAQ